MMMFGSSRRRKDEPDGIDWEKYRDMLEYEQTQNAKSRWHILFFLLLILLAAGAMLFIVFFTALNALI